MSKRVKPVDSTKSLRGLGLAIHQLDILCPEKSDSWKKDLFGEFLIDLFAKDQHHPGMVSREKQDEIFSGRFSAKAMRKESGRIGTTSDTTSFVRAVQRRVSSVSADPIAMRFLNTFAWWLQDKKYLLDSAATSKDSEFREAGLLRKCMLMLSSSAIPQRFDPLMERPTIPGEMELADLLNEARLSQLDKGILEARWVQLEDRLDTLRGNNRGHGGEPGSGGHGRGGGGGSALPSGRKRIVSTGFDDITFPTPPTVPITSAGAPTATPERGY